MALYSTSTTTTSIPFASPTHTITATSHSSNEMVMYDNHNDDNDDTDQHVSAFSRPTPDARAFTRPGLLQRKMPLSRTAPVGRCPPTPMGRFNGNLDEALKLRQHSVAHDLNEAKVLFVSPFRRKRIPPQQHQHQQGSASTSPFRKHISETPPTPTFYSASTSSHIHASFIPETPPSPGGRKLLWGKEDQSPKRTRINSPRPTSPRQVMGAPPPYTRSNSTHMQDVDDEESFIGGDDIVVDEALCEDGSEGNNAQLWARSNSISSLGPMMSGHVADDIDDDLPDDFIPEFVFGPRLGEGHFGEVFRVRCVKSNREFAVKRAKTAFKSTVDRDKALREAEMWKIIGGSPRVVPLIRAWQEGGYFYLQMKLCEGGNLAMTSRTRALEEAEIWTLLRDAAAALAHIHSHNLVYNDVKPANMYLSSGRLYLGDFGHMRRSQSRDVDEGDSTYMPLEMLELNRPAYASSDIFSLGISFLELAGNVALPETGTPLWRDIRVNGPPLTVFVDASQTVMEPIIKSPTLDALVRKMMDIDPTKRPSALDVVRHPQVKSALKTVDRELSSAMSSGAWNSGRPASAIYGLTEAEAMYVGSPRSNSGFLSPTTGWGVAAAGISRSQSPFVSLFHPPSNSSLQSSSAAAAQQQQPLSQQMSMHRHGLKDVVDSLPNSRGSSRPPSSLIRVPTITDSSEMDVVHVSTHHPYSLAASSPRPFADAGGGSSGGSSAVNTPQLSMDESTHHDVRLNYFAGPPPPPGGSSSNSSVRNTRNGGVMQTRSPNASQISSPEVSFRKVPGGM